LARRAGVSEPTVTRFSRAVGCAGVRELKVKLAQSLVVGRIYLEEPPHVGGGSTMIASEAKHRFFRLGIAVSNYSDAHLMRMVAATLGKKDVLLAISATGKPKEIIDAVNVAKEYGTTVIAITKPNSPLAALADFSLGLYVPETPNALKPTASRYAFLAAVDLLAASTAYLNPRETQERMRRIKYALVNVGNGDADGPLGD
jgi:DNA-binding MurR/RpiR family transcriptional regulator